MILFLGIVLISISLVNASNTQDNDTLNIDNNQTSTTHYIQDNIPTKDDNNLKSSENTVNSSIKTSNITYAQKGSLVNLSANVVDENNNSITKGKMAFKINGLTIDVVNVTNKTTTIAYNTSGLSTKSYTITIVYGGYNNVQSSNISSILTITPNTDSSYMIAKQNVTIGLASYKIYQNSTATIKATFTQENNTKITNQICVFKINGVTIAKTNITNGTASIIYKIPIWKVKNYTFEVKIGETETTNSASKTSTLTILKNQSATLKTYIILDELYYSKLYNKTILTARIVDSNNKSVNGGKFIFKIDGKSLNQTTVSNGYVFSEFKTSSLSTSTLHTISAVYGGYLNYNSSRNTTKLRVSEEIINYTYDEVIDAINRTRTFIETNYRLPNYITIRNQTIQMVDYLYLVGEILTANKSYINSYYNNTTPTTTTNCIYKNITKEQYMNLAEYLTEYIKKYNKMPTKLNISTNTLSFNDTLYMLTRIAMYKIENDKMLDVIAIVDSSFTTTNITPLIKNNRETAYTSYLSTTSNCQVNNTLIKQAVYQALYNTTGTLNQAKAIFDYVNDITDYTYYTNTRYGAVKTLKLKTGNCVDLSHLLVAIYRTANIPARYAHGKNCVFTSGTTTGHVWAEVYVNGTWYQCDASSYKNGFDNIVNWNGCSSITRYKSLPF